MSNRKDLRKKTLLKVSYRPVRHSNEALKNLCRVIAEILEQSRNRKLSENNMGSEESDS